MRGVSESTSAAPPAVPDAAVQDLRERLGRVRRVDVAADTALGGVDAAWIDRLLDVWAHRYDWRAPR